jgi:hypothetical protein
MRIWKIPWDIMRLLAFLMPRHEARDAKLQSYRLEQAQALENQAPLPEVREPLF